MAEANNMIVYDVDWGDSGFDVEKCRASAESGYAPAQDMMGNCYKYGAYVSRTSLLQLHGLRSRPYRVMRLHSGAWGIAITMVMAWNRAMRKLCTGT